MAGNEILVRLSMLSIRRSSQLTLAQGGRWQMRFLVLVCKHVRGRQGWRKMPSPWSPPFAREKVTTFFLV